MTILDSNVWIAFLNKADSQHQKAEKIFREINDLLVITEYIILEVCSVLSLRVNKKMADNFLKTVIDNENVSVLVSDENFFLGTIENFLDYSGKNLSFIDMSLLYLSASYNIITFDDKLNKAIMS